MAEQYADLPKSFLDEYCGHQLARTAIAFIVLDTFFVLLRFLSQCLRPSKYGVDDALIVLGWMFVMAQLAVDLVLVHKQAIGYHIQAQELYRPQTIPTWGVLSLYVNTSIVCFAGTVPKLGILALYLRIFVTKWARYACYATAAILVIAAFANLFTIIFQCHPQAKAWDPTIETGGCNDIQAHLRYGSVPNILTDVIMLIIPIPIVARLHATRRSKAAIMITFGVGSVGMIAAILRMVAFFRENIADGTWAGNIENIYTAVESSTYLISACLLSCRSLLTSASRQNLTKILKGSLPSWNLSFLKRSQSQHGVELRSLDDRASDGATFRRTDKTWNTTWVNGAKQKDSRDGLVEGVGIRGDSRGGEDTMFKPQPDPYSSV